MAKTNAQRQKEYYERNKEKIKERRRANYNKNEEARKRRERYANDPEYREKILAQSKINKVKYAEAMKEGRKTRRDLHKKLLIEYKGGCCVMCGTTENLQFDHIDRRTKSFDISTRLEYSLDKLKEEADKCVLLCKEHHEIKSTINHDRQRLADGWRVVSAVEEGDEMIVRLKKEPR